MQMQLEQLRRAAQPTPPRPAQEMSLHVVGAAYPNPKGYGNRQFEIAVSKPGDMIELELEPKNPADPNAVAVYSARAIQIGYLTAEKAAWISGMMRQGRVITAIFQDATQWGAVIRVAFDGGEPSLPAVAPLGRVTTTQQTDWDGVDYIPPDD